MKEKILTIKKSTLVDIANEVRAKTGSTDLIKVADLDDAVAKLSGGGVVEVDVLPEPYLCTPVPNSGYVEKVYFDTSLSIEQVVAELKKLTYDDYGGNTLLVNDNFIIIAMMNDGVYIIVDDEGGIVYFASEDPSGEGQFPVGWNSTFNGEIEIQGDVISEDGSVGMENDKIANLFHLDKQPNPEFNAEVIYKLPDETLWMWSDDKFIQSGEKLSPMSLGNANNPEFGFYYGQVFSMDDPITIDAKILIEEMQKLDTSEFYFNSDIFNIMIPVYNPNSNYISVKQLYATVYVDQETEEISIEIGNTDDYSILNKTYTIPYTGKLTITLRQLYKDAYTQNDEPMSAESVDALISTFPLRYGYVCAGYNSYSCESGQSNWWSTGDFNNPENAIYKCLKIGK